MLMFPNGLILARWSLREALFENLCVWLDTTRAGSKMDIVDTHSPRLWDVTRISCKLQTPAERRVQRRVKLHRDAV